MRRSYWGYSIGLAVAWALVLGILRAGGDTNKFDAVLLVFCGFAISWVSGTIARYVYPPPRKWKR